MPGPAKPFHVFLGTIFACSLMLNVGVGWFFWLAQNEAEVGGHPAVVVPEGRPFECFYMTFEQRGQKICSIWCEIGSQGVLQGVPCDWREHQTTMSVTKTPRKFPEG